MSRPREETVDQRLARLRDATGALAPPGDLAGRIARAAASRAARPGMAAVVLPFARSALVAAALAAAAAVALAIQVDHQVDEVVGSVDGALWEP